MREAFEVASILTLGHSNHSLDHFLALLRTHAVTAIADVRSKPYTKYAKHFCREPLSRYLEANGVRYVFLGDLIGGKPDAPELLGADGKPDYARIAVSPAFAVGIERVVKGMEAYTIALMCGEEDPSCCHRHHLIAPFLAARGVAVSHIRGDGSVVADEVLVRRAAERAATDAKAASAVPERKTLFS